jgi:RNA polymerase sigma factor (sigma-70 family)
MDAWAVHLGQAQYERAWDEFLHRYRRVIFAAIRHYARDYDDVMDVFAHVCAVLRADDLARLRSWLDDNDHTARFSTWLIVVVRHLTVDWFRHRDGRPRIPAFAEKLPGLQRRIFEHVFVEQRSHLETFELLRTAEASELSFRAFLEELRRTYRAVTEHARGALVREMFVAPPDVDPDTGAVETAETSALLQRVLEGLSAEEQVAVKLYVVDGASAVDVGRILGWPVKTVYNRVYRAMASVREQLLAAGLTRDDL